MMVFPMSLSFPFTLQELQTTESLHSIAPGLRNKWGHNASRSEQDLRCASMRLNEVTGKTLLPFRKRQSRFSAGGTFCCFLARV